MIHKLKIEQEWYDRLASGEKKCEVREHDRDYQAGDLILFTVGDSELSTWRITHVLPLELVPRGVFNQEPTRWCVLSVERFVEA